MMSEVTLVPDLLDRVPKSGLALSVKAVPEVIVNRPVLVEYVVTTSKLDIRVANSSAP